MKTKGLGSCLWAQSWPRPASRGLGARQCWFLSRWVRRQRGWRWSPARGRPLRRADRLKPFAPAVDCRRTRRPGSVRAAAKAAAIARSERSGSWPLWTEHCSSPEGLGGLEHSWPKLRIRHIVELQGTRSLKFFLSTVFHAIWLVAFTNNMSSVSTDCNLVLRTILS